MICEKKFTRANLHTRRSFRSFLVAIIILTISNDVSRLYCRPLKTDRTKLKAIRRSVEHGVRIKRQLVISQVVVSLSQASNRIDDSSLLLLLLSRGGRKTQSSGWIFYGERLDKFSRSIFLLIRDILIGDIYNARIVSTPAKFHASIYVSCRDTRRVENELWRSVSADIAMLSSPLSRGKIALFGHFVRRITLVRFAVNFCSFSSLTLSVDSFRSPLFLSRRSFLSFFFSFLFFFI